MRAAAPFLPERSAARRGYYVTSMDRIGLALGAGGVGGAAVTAVLLAIGGTVGTGPLATGALIGGAASMAGILVLLGPVWALLHRAHRRGPVVAALACAGVASLLLLMLRVPVASSGAAALVIAAAAAGTVMQQVAYRRIL